MARPTNPFSRRLRRVYATVLVLLVTGGIVGAGYYAVRQRLRPSEYQPGEANADITASLAQGLPREAPRPRLTDVTAEVGLGTFRTFAGHRSSQLPEDMGAGAAWGDYDNDGDDDLFLVGAGAALNARPENRAPSRLYENVGGRFRRVEEFPDVRIIGMGAAWGDADGDGWIDLVITGYQTLHLYRNVHGRFVRDTRFPGPPGFWSGAAWGDYDHDGDLDLYVCGYVQYAETDANRARASDHYGTSVPYTLNPASYKPHRNLLLRNSGDGRFRDVAETLGVANPQGRSLSALWHDFDEDGWIDLYVANDISDNVLYRNTGNGRFVDVSHPAWVADYRGAMGLAAGDWNRDGDDDLFITHWAAQENALYDSLLADAVPAVVPTSTGRTARALARFVDAADSVGLGQLSLPMVGWGTEFVDLDADGWLDLVVANGSTFETADTPRRLKPQAPFVFWNRRGEHFHDLAPLDEMLARPRVARGLAVSDYDMDGDVDVLLVLHDGGVQLLRNDMQRGHWLKLVVRRRSGGEPLVPAWGATVQARVGNTVFRRSVSTASYLSQSSSVLHIGLGAATRADVVDVRWRGDLVTTFKNLAADRVWEIVEGEAVPRERVSVPEPGSAAGSQTVRPLNPGQQMAFWDYHRAGMDALKGQRDPARAVGLFQRALAIDASHEDARYYLGSALAEQGDVDGALAQFDAIRRVNPQSLRAHARWGTLRAETATAREHLAQAEAALAAAHAVNPEETGALLGLGEVMLMQGKLRDAEARFTAASTANPRAADAWFFLGYVRWKAGDRAGSERLLAKSRAALGPDWKPRGTTAEGDVLKKAHAETTPLAGVFARWNGAGSPSAAYTELDRHLRELSRAVVNR